MKNYILSGILCLLIGISTGFAIIHSDTPNMTFHEFIPIEHYKSKSPIFFSKQVPACNYELSLRAWLEDAHIHEDEEITKDILIGINSMISNVSPIGENNKYKIIPVTKLTNLTVKITDYENIKNLPTESLDLRLECPIFGGENKFLYMITISFLILGVTILIFTFAKFGWRRLNSRR